MFRRFPVTLSLLSLVLGASLWTLCWSGNATSDAVARFGFAPRHFEAGDFLRLLSSAFLTHDVKHLSFALVMIVLAVGWLEQSAGSLKALCTFAVTHIVSLTLFGIGIGAAHWLRIGEGFSAIYATHDVGPSVGYYGCLGSAIAISTYPRRKVVAIALIGLLTLRVLVSIYYLPASTLTLSADAVHVIAALIGIFFFRWSRLGGVSMIRG